MQSLHESHDEMMRSLHDEICSLSGMGVACRFVCDWSERGLPFFPIWATLRILYTQQDAVGSVHRLAAACDMGDERPFDIAWSLDL